jgi:hypothetical protein
MFSKRCFLVLAVVLLALSACKFRLSPADRQPSAETPAGPAVGQGSREQVPTATVPPLATATYTPAPAATATPQPTITPRFILSTPTPTETPSPRLALATPQPTVEPTRVAPEGNLPAPPDRGPLPALWTEIEFRARNRVFEQPQGALNLAPGPAPAGTYQGRDLALDAGSSVVYVLGRCGPFSLSDTVVPPTCISAFDLAQDRVLPPGAVQLPSYVQGEGRLYVAGETLYLHRRWSGVLHALDRETLTVRETISDVYGIALDKGNVPGVGATGMGAPYIVTPDGLSRLGTNLPPRFVARRYGDSPVEMAFADGQVYVLTDTALQVYDANLTLEATIQNPEGRLSSLTHDEGKRRLYVGSYDGLYELDLRNNELVKTPADVVNALGLAVDVTGGRAFVLTSRSGDWYGGTDVVAVDTTSWRTERLFETRSGQLRDLVYDGARGRLLVASTDDHALIPIDLASGEAGPRLPLGIEVIEAIVSPADDRLYVSDSAGWIHVLDRRTYADIGRVYGGRYISLDAGHGRLYAGDERVPAVTAFSTASLTVERTFPQPGKPRANPSTGEVVIVNRKFYVYDGATGKATGDLQPGIGEPLPECLGCYYTVAHEVTIDAQRGLTATITYTPWPGKPGPGESIDYDPASGRAYYALLTGGYVRYTSLAVYPDLGRLQARDQPVLTLEGLGGDIRLDPPARRLYVARDNMLFVLDSETLNRVGRLDTDGLSPRWTPTIAAVDGELGRLYTPRGSELLVWTRTGGAPPPSLPPEPMTVTNTVASILPSPNYAMDGTLLATIDGRLARSTDRGQTWVRLRGGLPEVEMYLYFASATFSPDYANDRRIFVGVHLGDTHGEGVYCSEDGGDTWAWCGAGLYDLRVSRVVPSPAFAQDRTLIAYARTQSGEAVYRSADAGGHWQLVLRQTDFSTPRLPRPEELFPRATYLPQFRCDYQGACERSDDGGGIWTPMGTGGVQLDRYVASALSPHYVQDDMVYFLTESGLYRVRGGHGHDDRNQVWSISTLPIMDGRDYLRSWASLAVAATGKDAHDLFLGSAAGEFYRFAASDLPWAEVAPVKVPPTIAPLPTACVPAIDPRLQGIIQVDLEALGCAVAPGEETGAAFQPFERGRMFWREDLLRIYVLQEDGPWASYEDTWTPELQAPDLVPPQGLYRPVRGFARVWVLNLGGPPSPIGWGTAPERGYVMVVQPFARGLLFSGADDEVYALYDDGTWEKL